MGACECSVPLEWYLVFRLDNLCRAGKCGVQISRDSRFGWRRRCCGAHVVKEIFGRGEWSCGRLFPRCLELAGGVDSLFLAFAYNRDVVAFAHHLDEARQA